MSSSSIVEREAFERKQLHNMIDEVIGVLNTKTFKMYNYGNTPIERPIRVGEVKEVLLSALKRVEYMSNIQNMTEIFPNNQR